MFEQFTCIATQIAKSKLKNKTKKQNLLPEKLLQHISIGEIDGSIYRGLKCGIQVRFKKEDQSESCSSYGGER